jgi:hypothetical protein
MGVLLLGVHGEISRKFPGAELQRFLRMNTVGGIQDLVQLEIDNSDSVGLSPRSPHRAFNGPKRDYASKTAE